MEKELEFVNTSEHTYLTLLCGLQGKVIEMMYENKLTDEQLEELMPIVNYVNEILNLPVEELNKNPKDMN